MRQATDDRVRAVAATRPSRGTPAGTTPAGTTPAGTTPAGTTPAGTTPAGTTPAGTMPARTRWPDVFTVPRSRMRAAIARAVFGHAVRRLPIRVLLPDGRSLGAGPGGSPQLVLHRPGDFYARVGASGLIGFGESYMAGDWDCADLTGLLTVFASQVSALVPAPLQRLRRLSVRRQPAAE